MPQPIQSSVSRLRVRSARVFMFVLLTTIFLSVRASSNTRRRLSPTFSSVTFVMRTRTRRLCPLCASIRSFALRYFPGKASSASIESPSSTAALAQVAGLPLPTQPGRERFDYVVFAHQQVPAAPVRRQVLPAHPVPQIGRAHV